METDGFLWSKSRISWVVNTAHLASLERKVCIRMGESVKIWRDMSLCSANTVDECVLNSESLGRNIFRKGPSPYDWFPTNGLNTRFIEKETIFTKTLNWRLKVKERQTFSSLDFFHSISRVHALYQGSHLRLQSRCYYDHNCTVI